MANSNGSKPLDLNRIAIVATTPAAQRNAEALERRLADLRAADVRLIGLRRKIVRGRQSQTALVWLAASAGAWLLIGAVAYSLWRWPYHTLVAGIVIVALVALHRRLRR